MQGKIEREKTVLPESTDFQRRVCLCFACLFLLCFSLRLFFTRLKGNEQVLASGALQCIYLHAIERGLHCIALHDTRYGHCIARIMETKNVMGKENVWTCAIFV